MEVQVEQVEQVEQRRAPRAPLEGFLPEEGIEALAQAIAGLESVSSRLAGPGSICRDGGDWLGVTLSGLDSRPNVRLLLTTARPGLPCRKLTGEEAAQQVRLWLKLR